LVVSFPFPIELAMQAAAAFAAAALALLAVMRLDRRGPSGPASILGQTDDHVVFLFDGGDLVDATPAAHQLLDQTAFGTSDWTRLLAILTPRFPGIEERLEALPERGTVQSADARGRLRAEMRGGLTRITLTDPQGEDAVPNLDPQSLDALERELSSLRALAGGVPALLWRQGPDGHVTWMNAGYLDAVRRLHGAAAAETWPPPVIFGHLPAASSGRTMRRLSLPGAEPRQIDWYDCHATPLGGDTLYTAIDANAAVLAEGKLLETRQSFTRTFAELTIGLAIFDRARQLVIFNPALTELTGLAPDFLAARPTLFGFLDKLRERHMIPEPRDYPSWRRHLVDLEAAAVEGCYSETWSLPHGRVYKVIGRPHPDGAIAFLFEDVSAEVSLTRQFREQLEVGHSALDAIEDPIAIFSPGGILVLANEAYGEVWGGDPETSLSDIDVRQATRRWMERTAPTPVWGDLREFVTGATDRSEWSADVRLRDGRLLTCRVAPIAGGSTMVRFQFRPDTPRAAVPVSRPA
jgi:PAS domain-containing protein